MLTILDFLIHPQSGDSYRLEVVARGQLQPLATATFDYPLSFMIEFELRSLDFDAKDPLGRIERLTAFGSRLYQKLFTSEQNLRSHSEPLQGRQWGVGFFKDEVALELTPCHSPLKTFTLYNQVGHQTQGNVMGLRLGLRLSRLLGRPHVACLTALEVELTFHYPDDLFDFLA